MFQVHVRPLLLACAALLVPQAARAEGLPPIDLSADVRLRVEQDWDSQTATGTSRAERARARIRLRVNAAADLGQRLTVRGRVRTGGSGSHQNANITFADFDGNPADTLKFVVDRYSLAWKGKSGGLEAGRMGFPFFAPNEYFWDGDISPLGAAGNVTLPVADAGKLKLVAGGFLLPAGLKEFSGSLYAGQAQFDTGGTTFAAGLFRFEADLGDPDRLLLLDGNGARDYTVLAVNAQQKVPLAGNNLVLGADLFQNLQSYAGAGDAFTLANRGERTGYVLSASWGDTSKPGRVQLGYRYSRMEQFAVNASYAHDDIARFGTAAQSRLTDTKGHDLYVNYALFPGFTAGVRAMFVERLTSIEDGKRVRLDLAYNF